MPAILKQDLFRDDSRNSGPQRSAELFRISPGPCLVSRGISIVRHQLSWLQEEFRRWPQQQLKEELLNRGNGESKTGVMSTPAAIQNYFKFSIQFSVRLLLQDFPGILNNNLPCTLLRTILMAGKIHLYMLHSESEQKSLFRPLSKAKIGIYPVIPEVTVIIGTFFNSIICFKQPGILDLPS